MPGDCRRGGQQAAPGRLRRPRLHVRRRSARPLPPAAPAPAAAPAARRPALTGRCPSPLAEAQVATRLGLSKHMPGCACLLSVQNVSKPCQHMQPPQGSLLCRLRRWEAACSADQSAQLECLPALLLVVFVLQQCCDRPCAARPVPPGRLPAAPWRPGRPPGQRLRPAAALPAAPLLVPGPPSCMANAMSSLLQSMHHRSSLQQSTL